MKKQICLSLALLLLLGSLFSASAQEVLSRGSTGKEVVALQKRLIRLRFLSGKADGQYGENTQAAVRRAQSYLIDQGLSLPLDGIAGKQTLSLLYDDTHFGNLLDLQMGNSGQAVLDLQNRLYDLHFLDTPADGQYGDQTRSAVLSLQKALISGGAQGVSPNGIADYPTRMLLKGDLCAYGIKAPECFVGKEPHMLEAAYLYAHTALVLDADTGAVLFEKEADKRMFPASTTKMMTLLLAVEKGDLDRTVTIPESAAKVPADSSLVPVYPGEKMTMRNLLYGLMLRSGNDAANAIATLCSGSVSAFVEEMNQKAAALGMNGTHFTNPHGYYNAEHYSTARDLALLGRHLMQNNVCVSIVSCKFYTLPATGKRPPLLLQSNNEILNPLSSHYYAGAFGIKSGYTRLAGFCYCGAAEKNGKRLIAVVLKCRTRNQAWADLKNLFNLGF